MNSDMYNLDNIRNEKLILEREAYENDFISLKDIQKSEEMDIQIIQNNFEREYSTDDLNIDYPFEHLDLLDFVRDQMLIEGMDPCKTDEVDFTDEFAFLQDDLDMIIEMHECSDEDYFIESYDDCPVDIDSYVEADMIRGYVPNNDPFDSLDGGYGYIDEPYGHYV